MDIHLNSEPVKYALVALTFPFWAPFARALWTEFNDALRDEGGLFGAAPTAEQLKAIERARGRYRSGMVSVTWDEHERLEGRDRRGAEPAPDRPAPAGSQNSRPGFRQR